jgi:hypothetical protein
VVEKYVWWLPVGGDLVGTFCLCTDSTFLMKLFRSCRTANLKGMNHSRLPALPRASRPDFPLSPTTIEPWPTQPRFSVRYERFKRSICRITRPRDAVQPSDTDARTM